MNGQEKDDEIAGDGNIYTAEFWQYDSRLGRRWNLDPEPIVGISDYACFTNNPIALNDPFGNSVDVGKKKEESEKKKVTSEKQTVTNADDLGKISGNEPDKDGNVKIVHNGASEVMVYRVDGKVVTEKEWQAAKDFNTAIDDYNKEIDRKIDMFKGAGFDVSYDKTTGLLNAATKTGTLQPYQQFLFDAVNSKSVYTFNVGGGKAFSFEGNNSFTMSSAALTSGNKPVLQKMIAADAAIFTSNMDQNAALWTSFSGRTPPEKYNPKIVMSKNSIMFKQNNKEIKHGKGKTEKVFDFFNK